MLAISGGIDSVCLFYALRELNYDIELAHCNFKLRGKASDEDEIFIRDLAKNFLLSSIQNPLISKTLSKTIKDQCK